MSRVTKLDDEHWMKILRSKVAESSISEVARQLDYSRSAISLVMSGSYNGGTKLIAAKVLATFTDYVECPFLGEQITQAECGDFQSRHMPTSEPDALRHWMACRGGCVNCFQETEEEASHA